jgi:hypothetical protein
MLVIRFVEVFWKIGTVYTPRLCDRVQANQPTNPLPHLKNQNPTYRPKKSTTSTKKGTMKNE